ncbi:MAG: protein kinase [Acidobacteriaceae bacterium]|nr:protein kinase [Acidobacteriaceae bacterium]
MSPQRWRQIEDLYHSARERGESALAGSDPEIRGEVEKLLAQDSGSGSKLLDQRAADLIADLADTQVTPGSRLGPYQIEAPLGRGGMGQVFRATDTRLGRKVAIKISNKTFVSRFERESRSIAAINHPHVCTLHDVGPNYLVMELVEGETLAARLKRGKLSIAQTIRFGSQIAEALAVAHANGIVHRDLKPANIMLTKSGVKVLDFGLAKSTTDPDISAASGVMGTPAYIAPEQLEGKEADARSDIYALGLVLSEMLTGKRSGHPPGFTKIDIPPALDRVLKRCLETDPDERWQSARDLKWELESSAQAPVATSSRSRYALLAGALVLATLLLAALALVHFRAELPSPPLVRMNVLLPEKSHVLSLAVAPDGRAIAMVLVKDGKQQIWVRTLDALEPAPLAGTDDAADPFWSPDSQSIAFFADARLKKIHRSGGPVQTLCDALAVLGGTWNRNGDILLGALTRVQRVSDAGGAVSDLPGHPAVTETYPSFLPDGRHYVATRASSTEPGVWLSSMDGPEARRILPDVSNAEIVEPPRGGRVGAVLFTRAGTLMALPFDMKRLEAAGDAFPVSQGIASAANSRWLAAASKQGVLAYVSGQRSPWQYIWRDRQGRNLGAAGDAGGVVVTNGQMMISPDGKQLAGDPDGEIWMLEFPTGVATQLTFAPDEALNPVWSPDGRYVAYDKGGVRVGIYRKPANGAGAEELLLPTNGLSFPKSWSPDGRFLIYAQVNPGTGADLLAFPIEADPHPFALAQTSGNEDQGQFSPDGHWVAYTSNESGLSEIYVIPFPPTSSGGRWLVSRGGGVQPRWRPDGKELFYISPDSRMMAVDVSTSPVFRAGIPQPLFQTEMVDTGIRTGPMSWDITPDGKRFLIITATASDTSSLNVVLNWRAGQQN